MDWETIKAVVDMGLGGIALALYYQQSKILKNHELRLTQLEAKPRKRR